MACIIMIIVGVGLSISNANKWFIVPDYCIWICFGVAGILAIVSIINYASAKHQINKAQKSFRRF